MSEQRREVHGFEMSCKFGDGEMPPLYAEQSVFDIFVSYSASGSECELRFNNNED